MMIRGATYKVLQQERLAGASLLIWANKQDLEGSLSVAEIAKELHLRMSTGQSDMGGDGMPNEGLGNDLDRHWSIQACSAMTSEGLLEGMDWLVNDIGARIFMLS